MGNGTYEFGSLGWLQNLPYEQLYNPQQLLQGAGNTGFQMPGRTSNMTSNLMAQQGDPGFWKQLGGILGSDKFTQGMSSFGSLAGIYTGFKALGLAEDQLDFSKYSFSKNFNAQARTYNNTQRDAWASRNAAAQNRGETYQDMASWLKPRQIEQV